LAARFAIKVSFLERLDEKAAGFWPAAEGSKKISADAPDESEN
jgi:hypothetical protein